jgi:hypothetical protein
MQPQRSYEERLKAFPLYGESTLPGREVPGAVYFEREKTLTPGVLRVESRPANVPGSAAALPIVVEIPFRGDEINRQ